METLKIKSFGPENMFRLKQMYRFHQKLYSHYKEYVPALKMESLGSKFFKVSGLWEKNNPIHEKIEVKYFLAFLNGEIVGSIAGIYHRTYCEYHQEKIGFFGLFEVIPDEVVSQKLLDCVKEFLISKGLTKMRGPMTFDHNGLMGLLINSFEQIPFMGTPYHRAYYQDMLIKYGFYKIKDLHARLLHGDKFHYIPEYKKKLKILEKVAQNVKSKHKVEVFHFMERGTFEENVQDLHTAFSEAWKENWGFVPLSWDEVKSIAHSLKIVGDPKLVLLVYVDDHIAGVSVTLPDINEVLYRYRKFPDWFKLVGMILYRRMRKYRRSRLLLLGILERYRAMGIDSILYLETFIYSIAQGYNWCELSWLLEDNILIQKAGEFWEAIHYKTWRIFEIRLDS